MLVLENSLAFKDLPSAPVLHEIVLETAADLYQTTFKFIYIIPWSFPFHLC